jgi:hypothetical protein
LQRLHWDLTMADLLKNSRSFVALALFAISCALLMVFFSIRLVSVTFCIFSLAFYIGVFCTLWYSRQLMNSNADLRLRFIRSYNGFLEFFFIIWLFFPWIESESVSSNGFSYIEVIARVCSTGVFYFSCRLLLSEILRRNRMVATWDVLPQPNLEFWFDRVILGPKEAFKMTRSRRTFVDQYL